MKQPKTVWRLKPEGFFRPADFAAIIQHLPDDCVLVGGQAVAWWAERYRLRIAGREDALTSRDIDFWGSRADLVELGKRTSITPVFPHEYEMTVWVGALPLKIHNKRTIAEVIHTVPGLDTNDPEAASIEQVFRHGDLSKRFLVLSPVSLVLAKLHALRHFDQRQRQDEVHLRVCLDAARHFIEEAVEAGEVRQVLWNCNRLIDASRLKFNQRLQRESVLNIIDSIPIAVLRRAAQDPALPPEKRTKLENFCTRLWPRLQSGSI